MEPTATLARPLMAGAETQQPTLSRRVAESVLNINHFLQNNPLLVPIAIVQAGALPAFAITTFALTVLFDGFTLGYFKLTKQLCEFTRSCVQSYGNLQAEIQVKTRIITDDFQKFLKNPTQKSLEDFINAHKRDSVIDKAVSDFAISFIAEYNALTEVYRTYPLDLRSAPETWKKALAARKAAEARMNVQMEKVRSLLDLRFIESVSLNYRPSS